MSYKPITCTLPGSYTSMHKTKQLLHDALSVIDQMKAQLTDNYRNAQLHHARISLALSDLEPELAKLLAPPPPAPKLVLNAATVAEHLSPLKAGSYSIHEVRRKESIEDFTSAVLGKHFIPGKGFYEWTKRETIRAGTEVLVMDRLTRKVYGGSKARELVGLQWGQTYEAEPVRNVAYCVFLQSNSLNRLLVEGTSYIYLK